MKWENFQRTIKEINSKILYNQENYEKLDAQN